MNKGLVSLADIFGEAMEREKKKRAPFSIGILPEAIVRELQETAKIYEGSRWGCPFKIGDIVHPRDGFNVNGHGVPSIVVEVTERRMVNGIEDSGSSGFGRMLDMRVLTMVEDSRACFWVESWTYEHYEAPAQPKDENWKDEE